jgi:hypothetical protein
VCERLLYTRSFKYPYWKKSGTMRSGDRTGHGIPIPKSALYLLLTRYLLNQSTVTQQNRVLKWRTSSVSRRTDTAPSPLSLAGQEVHFEMCHPTLYHPVL